jgi:AcrR family transcriptional regulator
MSKQKKRRPDRRIARTRAAILAAFNRHMFTDGYNSLSATAIAESANVSRSTFYSHFPNCDAVLAESVGRLFAQLAHACLRPTDDGEVAQLCSHFWEGRRLARAILTGRRGEMMVALLADKLQATLAERQRPGGSKRATQFTKSVAIYLASAHIGLLFAWLTGRVPISVQEVASILHSGSRNVAAAYTRTGS